jgi:hypothetical protein
MKFVEFVFQKADGSVMKLEYPWHESMSVRDILALSHADFQLNGQKLGVFGKLVEETTAVFPGDRVEIYTLLRLDPKDARRKRVKKKK